MEKKYFKQIEKLFLVMALLAVSLTALFIVLAFFGISIFDVMHSSIGAFVFGNGGLMSTINDFFLPTIVLERLANNIFGTFATTTFVLRLCGLLPAILFVLAYFNRKVRHSKYAFRFKMIAIAIFGFNIISFLLLQIIHKVNGIYAADTYVRATTNSVGVFANVILIVKCVLLLAAYYYVKELTNQHLNRKQDIDADLSDTIFADIEKREIVLMPTSRLKRLLNYMIDLYFANCLIYGAIYFISGYSSLNESNFILSYFRYLNVYAILVVFVYYFIMEAMFSVTVGKVFTGTLIVDEDAKPIGFGKALLRTTGRLIPFEQLSIFGQAPWHDSISKTFVVNTEDAEFEQG